MTATNPLFVLELGIIIRWWILFGILFGLGMPIAGWLFAPVPGPDAGFGLPLVLGILIFVVYWIGRITMGWIAYVGSLAVLVTLAMCAWRIGGEIDGRSAVETFTVFTLAFVFGIALKLIHPDISPGAEHFLDFGLLQSTLRAETLPPEDMWFAGKPVRYYYGGHLLMAVLTELTWTPTRYAYNLAFAGIVGTFITAVYEFAGSIAAANGGSRKVASGVAAFYVGIASNLMTPLQLVQGFLLRVIPGSALTTVWPGARETAIKYPSAFDYLAATRVIPGTINEFPFFAFVNGNPHPHVISPPLLVVSAALAYSYYRTPRDALRRRRLLIFGAVPSTVAVILVVDSWSFPTALGLTWLALVFAPARVRTLLPDLATGVVERYATDSSGSPAEVQRIVGAAILTLVLGLGSIALVFPFFLSSVSGRSIAILAGDQRSGLFSLLVVHGVFLVPFGLYFSARSRPRRSVQALLGLGILAFAVRFHALLLFLPLVAVGWLSLRGDRDVGFETVLIVGGAGLLLLTEVVYLQPLIPPQGYAPRVNTVFKTYFQVWVLWGAAAGVVLQRLLRESGTASALPVRDQVGPANLKTILAGVVVVSTVSYGGLWLATNAPQSGSTLDGLEYAEQDHPHEMEAIHWTEEHVTGQPTIVSAPGLETHRWEAGAVASMTGLPTVAGWSLERYYRGWDAYIERVHDVNTIYEGSSTDSRQLLKRYDVEYIYVGPTERDRYDIRDFSESEGITSVFRNERVTIYRVQLDRLTTEGN